MWTRFMDMHSGGGLKEGYGYIYIEAPCDEAKVIFYNRFGHSPDRVSCTCCGEDYSIDEYPSIEKATAYERGCRYAEDKRGWLWGEARPKDYKEARYLEPGQKVPRGMQVKESYRAKELGAEGWTVAKWRKNGKGNIEGGVLFIDAKNIKPEERVGAVPKQGYVWMD